MQCSPPPSIEGLGTRLHVIVKLQNNVLYIEQ